MKEEKNEHRHKTARKRISKKISNSKNKSSCKKLHHRNKRIKMNYEEYKAEGQVRIKIKTPLYFDTKNEEIIIENKKDIKQVVKILEYALQEYKMCEKILSCNCENRIK